MAPPSVTLPLLQMCAWYRGILPGEYHPEGGPRTTLRSHAAKSAARQHARAGSPDITRHTPCGEVWLVPRGGLRCLKGPRSLRVRRRIDERDDVGDLLVAELALE